MYIEFIDIINAITKTLSDRFPDNQIYIDEIEENMITPCFQINLMPLTIVNENNLYRQQNVLIDISYITDTNAQLSNKNKCLEMSNKLQNVLNEGISVLDNFIDIQELEFDIVDKILHTTFYLMWYNNNEVTENELDKYKIMQEFTINKKLDNY